MNKTEQIRILIKEHYPDKPFTHTEILTNPNCVEFESKELSSMFNRLSKQGHIERIDNGQKRNAVWQLAKSKTYVCDQTYDLFGQIRAMLNLNDELREKFHEKSEHNAKLLDEINTASNTIRQLNDQITKLRQHSISISNSILNDTVTEMKRRNS